MLINYTDKGIANYVYRNYCRAIEKGNGLAAKWAPRKGAMAKVLREAWGMSPKAYRKFLVNNTKVVETQMCNKDWERINFSQVPSLAHARYKKAFIRNAGDVYKNYLDLLTSGTRSVKINASAVYPYDILKTVIQGLTTYSSNKFVSRAESQNIIAQWDALPNFIGDARVLPVVDVSGSMGCKATDGLTCMDVAVSLGLYFADKNKGDFRDVFCTFSSRPELVKLKGNIVQKIEQMVRSHWSMSTNLHAIFDLVLKTAKDNKVPQSEMPETVVIFSDMQFNRCIHFDDSAMQMIRRKYEQAGYTVPTVVFWNINDCGNVPVAFDESGVALVSGFSPAIAKTVLSEDIKSNFTPEAIMLATIMNERYNF